MRGIELNGRSNSKTARKYIDPLGSMMPPTTLGTALHILPPTAGFGYNTSTVRETTDNSIRRVLVVLPNWVGDVVMASPVLAAVRAHFASARITYLMRPYVAEIVDGCGWHDEAVHWPGGKGLKRELATLRMAKRMRADKHELALLLTNSFRSALAVSHARVPQRVGYARDGRGLLLNTWLKPLKKHGEFVPSPVLPYYIRIAEAAGCTVTDRRLRLGISPAQEEAGQSLLRHYGLEGGPPYALVNTGAAFGASKCWLPERFAEVCDRLHDEHNMRAVLVGSPGEAETMRRIADQARTDVICMENPGTTLGSLKVLAREAALLVCNDTGPRHYGNAFNLPTVTIFGPTHQEWTETDFPTEIILQEPVECGPCQLKTCPIDLRCMTSLTVDRVMAAVDEVLMRPRPAVDTADTMNTETALTTGRED